MFSAQTTESAIKEQEEMKEKRSKKIIPVGLNMLSIKIATLEYTKKGNEPMIVLEYQMEKRKGIDPEKYKTFKDYFYFGEKAPTDDNGQSITEKKLINFMYSSFGYRFKECADLNEALEQIKEHEKVLFRAVIKHEKRLNNNLQEFLAPAISFTGKKDDENVNENSYDPDKLVIPLSEKDRKRLSGVSADAKNTGGQKQEKPENTGGFSAGDDLGDAPDTEDEDDLPF